MTKLLIKTTVLACLSLVAASAAMASEGGNLQPAHTNMRDIAGLQHGAKLFMNYCSGCHSLEYLRYSRMASDLHLTEQEVMDNPNFTGAKFQEPIVSALPADDAAQWFG